MIKFYSFLVLLLFCVPQKGTGQEQLLVVKEKRLLIKGKTSIGRFECECKIEGQPDTIVLGSAADEPAFQITIPVEDFDCGKRLLNKDFYHTLKSDEYPDIQVSIKKLVENQSLYVGDISLKLVGKELMLGEVGFEQNQLENGCLLNSVLEIGLAELELTAPRRFFGLIKLKNDLSINITLMSD